MSDFTLPTRIEFCVMFTLGFTSSLNADPPEEKLQAKTLSSTQCFLLHQNHLAQLLDDKQMLALET